ncbi:MAG: potassium channel protein [Candidatus Brocadiia bacterium]
MNFRRRIIVSLFLLSCVLATGTIGYWIIGGKFLDALYMTVITSATVGYGEVVPVSNNPGAEIFTIIFIILSVITIGIITSLLVASILELEMSGFLRRRKMNKEIGKLTGHYIICGAGETGIHIVQEMSKMLMTFVVIDRDQPRLEKLAALSQNILYLVGDATDDEILLAAGVERANGVMAALPSDKDNLYITVMAKQYNPKMRIVALGVEDKAVNKLKKAGADTVVSPALIGGLRMASEMTRPSATKFLDTMLRQTSGTYRIEEISIPAGSHVINKKLSELGLRDKYSLLILAIMKSDSDEITYSPPADTALKEGSILVVLGEIHSIKQVRELV